MSNKVNDSEAAKWSVVESDGASFIVAGRERHTVLVSWDHTTRAWQCSAHGSFAKRAMATCIHVVAATRSLPLRVALELGNAVSEGRRKRLRKAVEEPKAPSETALEEARVAIARAEARTRDGRVAERDDEHRRRTSEVTTRRITDEDRERIRRARERKQGLFGSSG